MEFLKKHYEKVILSVVLLGLGVVAFWLPKAIQQAQQSAPQPQPQPSQRSATNAQALPPEIAQANEALKKLNTPPVLNFTTGHRVFNPFTWTKRNGALIKITVEGAEGLTLRNGTNRPLNLAITFEDRPAANGVWVSVLQQSKGQLRAESEFLKPGDKSKTKLFTFKSSQGTTNNPSAIQIEMADNTELVTIQKGSTYQKIETYSTDLKYDPDNKTFLDKRINQTLSVAGRTYKIIVIESNKVILVDTATGKQTTIP